MKTLAIDFETANGQRVSACSFGLAWIEGDGIARKEHRLICPKGIEFNDYNVFLHKIRPQDVVNQPDFATVFSEFASDITGALVLAHQAEFEISVIRETLQQYRRTCPEFSYLCTRMISQVVWPGCAGHSLEAVTDYLGISFRHHDAEEDAVACAKVALAAARAVNAASFIELANRISLRIGQVRVTGIIPCSFQGEMPAKDVAQHKIHNTKISANNLLHFTVEGSTGNVYEIVVWRVGGHFYMTCTCEAGRNGRFCKHRDALLNGIIDHLLSDNADEVSRVAELIRGTEAERLFLIVQRLENRSLEDETIREAKGPSENR